MATTAAVFSSFHMTSSFLAKPSLSFTLTTLSHHRHSSSLPIRRIAAEFNITFAPSNPKPKPSPIIKPPQSESDAPQPNFGPSDLDSGPFFIPWIVRDEKGNLSMQSQPPARYLAALAETKPKPSPKRNNSGKVVQRSVGVQKVKVSLPTAEPRYSKAARRYYNENFRTPPQRLSKVLAAAGGILCFQVLLVLKS